MDISENNSLLYEFHHTHAGTLRKLHVRVVGPHVLCFFGDPHPDSAMNMTQQAFEDLWKSKVNTWGRRADSREDNDGVLVLAKNIGKEKRGYAWHAK